MSVTVQQIQRTLKTDLDEILTSYASVRYEKVTDNTLLLSAYKRCAALKSLSELIEDSNPHHQWVYLFELSADSCGVMHSVLTGDLRGARFYLRSIIENLLRHIYYSSHPVEYDWAQDGKGYIEQRELREYVPRLAALQHVVTLLSDLFSEYSSLSKHVHSGAAGDAIRTALSDISLTNRSLQNFMEHLHRVTKCTIAVLWSFHADRVNQLNVRNRIWLTHQLDNPTKALLRC